MEIDRAKWLIKDYATKIGSTFAEAVKVVDEYITDLENKLNNKEKVIVIDQEELILRITQLHKKLNNERNAKEREITKTAMAKSKALIRKELEIIDNKQEIYMEIINLIKEL